MGLDSARKEGLLSGWKRYSILALYYMAVMRNIDFPQGSKDQCTYQAALVHRYAVLPWLTGN